jgi:hypothetical protein
MPITIEVDHARRRVFTRARGNITYDEIRAHLSDQARLQGLAYPELVDATGATTDLTSKEVRELVTRTRDLLRHGPLGPTAIVATHDVLYGMARMYEILAGDDGVAVGVFRSVADAERWLSAEDLPPTAARPSNVRPRGEGGGWDPDQEHAR